MTQKIKTIESEGGIRFVVKTEKPPNNFQNYFKDFCKKTSLYGFEYVGETRRYFIERFYWIFFILLSLSFSGFFAWKIWSLKTGNEIILIEEDFQPIWKVPFPAVTICPETKIKQSVYNFTDFYHRNGNLTAKELNFFSDASLLCDNHLFKSGNKTTSYKNLHKIIQQVSPAFQELFLACKWSNQISNCSKLFKPFLTDDGLCYTFNSFETNSSFLKKSQTPGTKSGLNLLLTSFKQDFDYVCRGPIQGFKLFLHESTQIPQMSTNFIRVPFNQEIVVSVKPNWVKTSESLKELEPTLRQCLYSNERKLAFYPLYNQENCLMECLGNFTLNNCGCVPYFMAHENLSLICGSGSNECVYQAEMNFFNSGNSCGCLPSCSMIYYDSQISQADFNWYKVLEDFRNNVNEFPGIQMSRLTIFFKNKNFNPKQRRFLYQNIEIWCFFGGILALFSGISFLTVAEFFYFLLLRIVCNSKKYGERMWGGPKN